MIPTNAATINFVNSDEAVIRYCALLDIGINKDADIIAEIIYGTDRRTTYIESQFRFTDEKYCLSVSQSNEKTNIKIYCSGKKSLLYALVDIAERIANGNLTEGELEGYPYFKSRGYIEGFYGKPWSFESRLSVMKLMAKNRMNTVYYAPKDDEYHRDRWSELYPEKELSDLKALLDTACDYEMDFYYCIAPGLSISYSSERDFELLMKKTEQLYSIGIKRFGLLLDDIDENFSSDEDREKYCDIVEAHTDLVERYYAFLKKLNNENRLTVCPMLYNGKGNEYYISKFGQSIQPDISVFWTGRDVCSRDLTTFEALKFIENTYHKPLYWDNYPVNDGTMHNEMHLAPIINRDKDLYKYSEGIISNCMEYAECSKIPLITYAHYLWNSESYNPDEAWEDAIYQVIGEENAQAFITFADHLFTSCLKDVNSKRINKLFNDVEAAFNAGDIGNAMMLAGEYIEKMNECREFLSTDRAICKELKKWANKFSVACDIVNALLEYVTDTDEELKEKIFELIDKYDSLPAKLTDINLREELGGLMTGSLFGE